MPNENAQEPGVQEQTTTSAGSSSWGKKMPAFWHKGSPLTSILPELLLPFSVLYFIGVSMFRRKIKTERLPVPVICIGNLTTGGAGKTPVAIEVAKMLQPTGKKISFISRGYGGRLGGPLKIEGTNFTARDAGDEPLLLARVATCWVGKDKLATAKSAIADGAEILVLDDGLQNPYLHKTLSIAVIDGGFGIGNGFTIPAGPLREPIPHTMKATDVVVIIGEDKNDVRETLKLYTGKLVHARMVPDAEKLQALKQSGKKFIAFAGLGLPEKFFATLKDNGLDTLDNIAYPDHYNYSDEDIEALLSQAQVRGAELITTEKDAVRIQPYFLDRINILPIKIEFEGNMLQDLVRNAAKN